jgi:DNA polymerase II large subunit
VLHNAALTDIPCSPGGVKDLAVVDDDTRKEVESFIKRKNAEGHSGTILHVSLAFEYGVRANTINSGGRQLVTSRQNAQGKRNGLYGTQLSTAITELRQRFENDNIHKNLALDKRFNFSQYDLDEMLQVNLDKYGITEGPIREHMIAHALAKGCVVSYLETKKWIRKISTD